MNLQAYFERIGYEGVPSPSLSTLQQLHAMHPMTIPFENLSPFLHEEVNLDIESLQKKLVVQKRGGYCFEHNLLFLNVLEAIGFKVTGLAARVLWNVPEGVVLPRTHMLLLVNIEGVDYIADVGFGGITQTAPVRLESNIVQLTTHEPFRLASSENGCYTLYAKTGRHWKAMYNFDLQEQHRSDYELSNWYVSTHPRSRFVNELIAGRAAPGCRHALINTHYSVRRFEGEDKKRELMRTADLMEVLERDFRVNLEHVPDVEKRLRCLVRRGQ